MESKTHGKVLNRERHSQCLDASGLEREGMTPTDVDGVLDYHGRAWLIIEIKYNSEPIPVGQQICFDRMAKAFSKTAPTLFIIADHYIEDTKQDVMVDQAAVREWSTGGRWTACEEQITVGELTDRFLTLVDEGAKKE